MGTPVVAAKFKLGQGNGAHFVDWDTDDIRYFIMTNAYAFNQAHEFVSDLTNHVTGTGAPGSSGASLTGKTVSLSGTTVQFFHDDVVIAQNAGGFSNGRVVAWAKWSGSAATSPLIMVMTEAADFGNVGGPLTLDADAVNGVLNW